jgi:hypothetical protein
MMWSLADEKVTDKFQSQPRHDKVTAANLKPET